jgi:adenylate kinase family enzyme
MNRVVILGRGGAGKSSLARRLATLTGLPVVELDKIFWRSDLTPMPKHDWTERQRSLTSLAHWIMDGDLGPYDVLETRLQAADTILILDFPLMLCFLRALRRSRERAVFWWWMLTWRWQSQAKIVEAVHRHARAADVHIFRTPQAVDEFLSVVGASERIPASL